MHMTFNYVHKDCGGEVKYIREESGGLLPGPVFEACTKCGKKKKWVPPEVITDDEPPEIIEIEVVL